MIARYERPEMRALWSEEKKFGVWLEIELLVAECMAEEGTIPKEAAVELRRNATVNVSRAVELEATLKHDVIAFLSSVSEKVGSSGRFLHRGMTSSDLLDTSLAVLLREAGILIQTELRLLREVIRARAEEFKDLPCIGRSHGIHAEPVTFGLKLLSFYSEFGRRSDELTLALDGISVGKIAGAVGTYGNISPSVEEKVLSKFGLRPEEVPSQIVHRDRHARFFTTLALLGSSVERLAVEIRHLQRTEVREVEEGFSAGQKGSSAMPHKKNPIGSENLSGLARLLRGYALSALENVPLWHERDISHSSVERIIAPDACTLAHYMLHRMRGIVKELVVYPERMRENLEATKGVIFSGTVLLALADRGVPREEAYVWVQHHAHAALAGGAGFQERLTSDPRVVQRITKDEIDDLFRLENHTRYVDTIFQRAIQGKDR